MSQSAPSDVLVLLLQIADEPVLTSADCCFYLRAEKNLPGKFRHLGGAERRTAASAFSQHRVGTEFNYHVKLRFWDAVLFRSALSCHNVKLGELEEKVNSTWDLAKEEAWYLTGHRFWKRRHGAKFTKQQRNSCKASASSDHLATLANSHFDNFRHCNDDVHRVNTTCRHREIRQNGKQVNSLWCCSHVNVPERSRADSTVAERARRSPRSRVTRYVLRMCEDIFPVRHPHWDKIS